MRRRQALEASHLPADLRQEDRGQTEAGEGAYKARVGASDTEAQAERPGEGEEKNSEEEGEASDAYPRVDNGEFYRVLAAFLLLVYPESSVQGLRDTGERVRYRLLARVYELRAESGDLYDIQ